MSRGSFFVGWLSLFVFGACGAFGQTSDDLAACRPPKQATDIADTAGAGPFAVPISVENGIVLVDAFVAGSGPLPMMIDTGAVDAIAPEAAAAVGLRIERSDELARGRAGHDLAAASTHASELRLGVAAVRDQPFLILGLPRFLADRGNRRPIAGILGHEFFMSFVVRLDYQKRLLTLTPPRQFRYIGSGICVPFSLHDRTPTVIARADGIVGSFAIDTGSNAGLMLNSDFVRKNGFDSGQAAGLRVNSAAIDGLVENVVTRLGRFDLAGAAILRPIAQFTVRQGDVSPDNVVSGSIGSQILQQFVITFDYARRELWQERSPAFGSKTRGGATGFQAAKLDGPDLRVMNVIPGAPAAAAGLGSGDVITEIDGIPSAAVGLAEMADLTHRPDGTVVRLRVLRQGSERIVVLTLRELVP
jgi:hypothetical protein